MFENISFMNHYSVASTIARNTPLFEDFEIPATITEKDAEDSCVSKTFDTLTLGGEQLAKTELTA